MPCAKRVARQHEAGSIWINSHFGSDHRVPLGGHKESNPGTDLGEVGLQGWYDSRVIWVKGGDRVPHVSRHTR